MISSRPNAWRLLLLVVSLAMVAAACTADPEGGDTTATAAATGDTNGTQAPDEEVQEPTDGEVNNPGVFVHAADDEPLSLDPAQVEPGEGGETVILQVYERLLEIAPDGPELVPGLATEVPTTENGLISEDGLTYTFPIREGVIFHDGTDLTADDVIYSWNRVMQMALPEGASGLLSDSIAGMAVVDDYTFEVTLQGQSASFLRSVVIAMVSSIVSQDAVEGNGGVVPGEPNEYMAQNAAGTGPYVLDVWNRSENIQLSVFEDYWGTPANLDVRIDVAADPDVRVLGLRAGDYDMIEADPSFIGDIEGAEGVTIYSGGLLLEPIHIGFNMSPDLTGDELPPADTVPTDFFASKEIRQAFNLTFDYDAFLNGALGGFGDFNPHYIPIGIFGHDPAAPVYAQDLAQAEELFRSVENPAGGGSYWDTGFTVTVVAESQNLFEIAAIVLKDSMAQLNPLFDIQVAGVAEALFDEAFASDPVPYLMWVKNADPFADPDAYMQAYEHPDGEWGTVHGFRGAYEDPDTIAQLIDAAAQELDDETRAGIYSELQTLLYDDPMWIIAAQEGIVNAHREWVQGFVLNPLWPRPNIKFALFDK